MSAPRPPIVHAVGPAEQLIQTAGHLHPSLALSPVLRLRDQRKRQTCGRPIVIAGVVRQSVASLAPPSWNQIAGFLETMRRLRDSSGFVA